MGRGEIDIIESGATQDDDAKLCRSKRGQHWRIERIVDECADCVAAARERRGCFIKTRREITQLVTLRVRAIQRLAIVSFRAENRDLQICGANGVNVRRQLLAAARVFAQSGSGSRAFLERAVLLCRAA